MINIEQVMLKLLELNKKGRASLLKRGVETTDDVTTEEIMQKIGEIPIYKFEQPIRAETNIITKIGTHNLVTDVPMNNGTLAEETNIILERGS